MKPIRAVIYAYDISSKVPTKDYPMPSLTLRKFSVRKQQSVWIVPLGQLSNTHELTQDLERVGADVWHSEIAECEKDKILQWARKYYNEEAQRIKDYIEDSIKTTTARLAEARKLVSVDETNAAIRYQQTAIKSARSALVDAESSTVAFDLTGETAELLHGIRAVVEARAASFMVEATEIRKEMKDKDPTRTGKKKSKNAEHASQDLPFGTETT